ncbi:MAG: hypothetical protein IKD62_06225 [Oscillospiraceae bacterium]|nr:hypothetical protein [Oscillospiraceae bacterium]
MQIDEATIKMITEVVIRVLAEMNIKPTPAASAPSASCCERPAGCCEAADPVVIPGKGIGRDLITEREVLQLVAKGQTSLVCSKKTIITALAADRLKAEGITVIRQ